MQNRVEEKIKELWVQSAGSVYPRAGDWAYASPQHLIQFTQALVPYILELNETYGPVETARKFGVE